MKLPTKLLIAIALAFTVLAVFAVVYIKINPIPDYNVNLGVALDQDNGGSARSWLLNDGVTQIEGRLSPDSGNIGLLLKMADGSTRALSIPNPGTRRGSGSSDSDLGHFEILIKEGLASSDADQSAYSVDVVAADLRKVLQITVEKLASQKEAQQKEAANRHSWTAKP